MKNRTPNYKQIYTDLLQEKYPEKMKDFESFFNKDHLSQLDVITLNEKIFGKQNSENNVFNQKFRAYSKSDILKILDHQKEYKLNNSQLANHFDLSRNTVTKWRKLFLV